jgi:hypothetical protein
MKRENNNTSAENPMRVMVIIQATPNNEAHMDDMPSKDVERMLKEMGDYNEELVKAGIMLAGEGLHPTAKGKRVRFSGGSKRTVVDGPFTESKELVAGFWIWQVKNMDEAVEWVKRCPDPMPGHEALIEIRPVHESEDFGEAYTPEVRAQEDRLREQLAQK